MALATGAAARVFRAPVRRRYGTYVLAAGAVWAVGVRIVGRRWEQT